MRLECVNEYLFNKGFELEQSYKGNKYYCSIYKKEVYKSSDEKMHIWHNNDFVFYDCIYKEVIGISLQRPYNLIEEIREFKINRIIKKEDTSL